MATCEICGTEFDELGVQIVLPGLAKSFDRIDCALRARNLAGPPAFSVKPVPAVFLDVGRGAAADSYGLPGLPAGLAAALAGRTRLALGGGAVAVALLIATTAHLSSRGGSESEAAAGSSLLPSPRYAADFADRARVSEIQTSVAGQRAPRIAEPEPPRVVETVHLVAHRSPVSTKTSDPVSSKDRARSTKHKAARVSSGTARTALRSSAGSVSTRGGWGWGDKNHAHSGPAKSSAAGAKAHGRGK